jgi:hypothetical protein
VVFDVTETGRPELAVADTEAVADIEIGDIPMVVPLGGSTEMA